MGDRSDFMDKWSLCWTIAPCKGQFIKQNFPAAPGVFRKVQQIKIARDTLLHRKTGGLALYLVHLGTHETTIAG